MVSRKEVDLNQIIDGEHLAHKAFNQSYLDERLILKRIKELKSFGAWNDQFAQMPGKDGKTPIQKMLGKCPEIVASLFNMSFKMDFQIDHIDKNGNTLFHVINLSLDYCNSTNKFLHGLKYLLLQFLEEKGRKHVILILTNKNNEGQNCVDVILKNYEEINNNQEYVNPIFKTKEKHLESLLFIANIYFELFPATFDDCKQKFTEKGFLVEKSSILSSLRESKLNIEFLGNFSAIPRLVLFYLFSFLEPKNLMNLFVLNKSFAHLLSSDHLWKEKCKLEFNLPAEIWNKNEKQSWIEEFKQISHLRKNYSKLTYKNKISQYLAHLPNQNLPSIEIDTSTVGCGFKLKGSPNSFCYESFCGREFFILFIFFFSKLC